MGWIHPLLMTATIVCGLYVLWQGWLRFHSVHISKGRRPFPWKLHVRLGSVALLLFGLGWLGGLGVSRLLWGDTFITGAHARDGTVIFILSLIGYMTGYRMDTVKRPRSLLPLIHGVNNLVLMALACRQAWTGYQLLDLLGL